MEAINDFFSLISGWLWDWPMIILLLGTHLFLTIRLCVPQRKLLTGIRLSVKKDEAAKGDVSQFGALATALAATIGTGNIVGVATAVALGGPGAVLWCWFTGIFGMATKYAEGLLAVKYRVKGSDGRMYGGPMYALERGLNMKWLAILFAVFTALASFGIGCTVQANSIALLANETFGIPTWVTGLFIMVMVGLVVVGGLKRIAAVTEKIVPFMVIAYMIGSLVIFITNIDKIGAVFSAIFKGAFAAKAAGGGIVGYGMKLAIEQGCKRGVFSNEAGLGSSVMVHSNSNVKEPVMQGMWGIFEVFADTIIVCTLTAFTALSSGLVDLETGHLVNAVYNGVELTKTNLISTAFAMQFGRIGSVFIAVSIMLFAFSTVLGWSHYGTKAAEYLVGEKRTFLYRILFVLLVFGGAVMGDNLAWDLADTFNGLMMIPNLIGVITLSGVVVRITKNYLDRQLRGLDVPPIYSAFPDVQAEQEKD